MFVEHRRLKQNPKSIHLEDNSKISLNIVPGNPAQILCDVSSLQREIKWIEWRRSNRSSPVLVKFANYQAYVDPDFSNRLSVDRHGHLLINPVLVEDYAIYKCTTYTIDNHIPMFAHGTSVELKISQSKFFCTFKVTGIIRATNSWKLFCNIVALQVTA